MTFSNDCVIPTVLSGTTEVRLNSDAAIQTPDGINTIVETVPYWVLIGAGTPDESYIGRFRLQSNDVSIEPARFMMSGINTGDAAFTSIASPVLRGYSLNTPNAAGVNVNLYAAAMGANTSGTSNVAIGDTPTTAAASTHDVGEFEMQSSDFNVPYPYKFPIAPSYAGLGAAANQLTNPNGQSFVKYPSGQGIPTAQRCLINTFYTNRDAKGVGSKFMGFVSFVK